VRNGCGLKVGACSVLQLLWKALLDPLRTTARLSGLLISSVTYHYAQEGRVMTFCLGVNICMITFSCFLH
jgi:hypothetical protein